MDAISAQSIANIAHFSGQALANTAWAYATLCGFDKPLMDALAASAIQKLHEFG